MTETAPLHAFLPQLGELWRAHPLAMTAFSAALVTIGLLIARLLQAIITAAGDEPPIRVKGGSLDLELLAKKGADEWDGTAAARHAKKGKHGTGKPLLILFPADTGRPLIFEVKNKTVTIVFTPATGAPRTLTITEHGNQTTIDTRSFSMALQNDNRVLHDSTAGYISEAKVDGTSVATFTAADKAEAFLVEL
jgi:hypothetical protein